MVPSSKTLSKTSSKKTRAKSKARMPKSKKSFGPLGDLIRNNRLELSLGLAEVAKACKCSVQFISNIEHGRAPLPWEKVDSLAKILKIPASDIHAANLAVRSDFQSFVGNSRGRSRSVNTSKTALNGIKDVASLVALTAKDSELRELLQLYQLSDAQAKKQFVKDGRKALAPTPVVDTTP